MKYTAPSFTVPASSEKSPENCQHGWLDAKRGRCVLCGEPVLRVTFTSSVMVFSHKQPAPGLAR